MRHTRRDVLRSATSISALGIAASASATASADCEGVPEWDPDATYTGGDEVVYEGERFTAEWWTQGTEPDDGDAVWTLEGPCEDDGGESDGPIASIDVTATTVEPDETVEFDGSDSTGGDASIEGYEWDLTGDGEADETGETASHSYAERGEYTVQLTVTDDEGRTDTAVVTITVGIGDDGPCGGVSRWESDATYQGGDEVVYDAHLWEARWWTQGDEPGASDWGPWENLERCGDAETPDPIDRTLEDVVPKPVDVSTTDAEFEITAETAIVVDDEAEAVGESLADLLRSPTGYDLPLEEAPSDATDVIELAVGDRTDHLGEEGYELAVDEDGVTIEAATDAGLFWGVQSLRQVLPAAVEADTEQSAEWTVPGGEIVDYPRFDFRGAHLDVARHFRTADEMKQFVDYLAQYKINHVHIHLTDDQGWRLEIEEWPELTDVGGQYQVDGECEDCYYTQAEYADIVEHAEDRFITVIPEIDMPGHTNAALASVCELNCDDECEDPYTGIEVGFSSLCVDQEFTYEWIEDVVAEVAELTPGPYFHIGGDEADPLSDDEYEYFMDRAVPIVQDAGKRPMGWHEILGADPPTETIGQFWAPDSTASGVDVPGAVEEGHEIIASPASHAYLDMKYHWETELGLTWAGTTSVRESYEWDPGSYIDGVDESSIVGPEAALWSETLETFADVEFMLFPRIASIAELGWTPDADTEWEDFRERVAGHGPRWDRQGINYYRSDQIDWPNGE
ncbi:family 20 glycosylhydrolase [Natrarchaeobius chitinivorans]|uniref:beta-N-acetylhexosaminidase n=1 Tax=Natrarchaeobius chitinivorans TaxID=1679083 RepID=A0A3N6MHN2_NATCH|nr:family 20 glycosylhydrolase [Natrarchaeobius chitinivorans]RQG93556.1 PKD domain-containing protein [Natrarchaeobius chitinivorans]